MARHGGSPIRLVVLEDEQRLVWAGKRRYSSHAGQVELQEGVLGARRSLVNSTFV